MLMANSWYEDLNAYIRLGEPKLKKKAAAWQTAIGLQAVDGLSVSGYLLKTAKEKRPLALRLPFGCLFINICSRMFLRMPVK